MRHRTIIGVIALVVLVTAAGCVGLGGEDGADDPATEQDARMTASDAAADAADAVDAPADAPVDDADDGEAGEVRLTSQSPEGEADVADRQLIHTGEVTVQVDDVRVASDEVRGLVAERDGFVSEATQETHGADNETWRSATLVVRVPSGTFDGSIAALEELGEVERLATETEDVTDQLVDLKARLENLRVERDRLRDLFEDANETRDVLAVQDELSSTQEEIERLEAQRESLEERVAYSTVVVHLTEEEPEPEGEPAEPAWYETSVSDAFVDSVGGVVVAGRAVVVGAAYATPYLLAFGPVAVVTAGVYRYHRR